MPEMPTAKRAGLVDQPGHLFVDRAGQHHFHHFDHGVVGDAQAVDEFAFNIKPFQHGVDLRPAAMDDDRVDADLFQQRDVAAEFIGRACLSMACPPYFTTMVAPA